MTAYSFPFVPVLIALAFGVMAVAPSLWPRKKKS